MKNAFLIMAYKESKQVEKLIKRLSHNDFHFYIHVDKKIEIKPFEYLEALERVNFVKFRKKIYWASWRFSQTVIECIEEILMSENKFDFITLLSGQDYPIVSNDKLISFYKNNIGSSFFTLEEENSSWWKEAKHRYTKYHTTNFKFKGQYRLQSFINAMPLKRRFPVLKKLYGGPRATWWIMHRNAADYVTAFLRKNEKIKLFCKYTWAPDEFLIPSVLMNSQLQKTVSPYIHRYIDWTNGGANPKILTIDDFDSLVNSGCIFARKFDFQIDQEIYNKLDEYCGIE